MTTTFRKTATMIAAVATAGAGSVFLGAAPASAATETCGPTGTLVAPGICELVFTETGAFTRTAEMTKLEVLLVGAGGDAVVSTRTTGEAATNGYAAAGGGGEVRVVDFSAATGEVAVTVGEPNGAVTGIAATGEAPEVAASGSDGTGSTNEIQGSGGDSGNANDGQTFSAGPTAYGAGGGAGGDGVGANGGAGAVVSSLVAPTSLFAGDDSCFGGGGAAGFVVTAGEPTAPVLGGATCGGGYATDATATDTVSPLANSGGGAGAVNFTPGAEADLLGADGYVAVRWPSQQVLAATGAETNTMALSVGAAALVGGIVLAFAAAHIRRRRVS